MSRTIRRSLVTLLVIAALNGATRAAADPVMITSGTFTATVSSSPFTFIGDGLRLSGAGNGLASSLFNCTPCTAASPIELSFSGDAVGGALGGGEPGEFDGVPYAQTFLAGNLYFTGPSFTSAMLSPDRLSVSAPFSMTGSIDNYASGVLSTSEPPLFTASLFGRGVATAQFGMVPPTGSLPALFTLNSVAYRFGSEPPAVTPEPASLVLLGTGLTGLVMRRLRRRQTS